MQTEVELVEKTFLSDGVWTLDHLWWREFHSYLTGSLHVSKYKHKSFPTQKQMKTNISKDDWSTAGKCSVCLDFVSHVV